MSIGQRLREIARAIAAARFPPPPKQKHDPYDPLFDALATPPDSVRDGNQKKRPET